MSALGQGERWIDVPLPFNAGALLGYLGARVMPGVEELSGSRYARVVAHNGRVGVIEIDFAPAEREGRVLVACDIPGAGRWALEKAHAVTDGRTDTSVVERHLSRDPRLTALVRSQPGVRIPGTTDPFELTVRAILGQQISIAGARTMAARVAHAYGTPLSPPRGSLSIAFPTAERLVAARLERLGVTRSRAAAIRTAAGLARDGLFDCATRRNVDVYNELTSVRGIGAWTAAYVMLRGLGDGDALPATDLGIRQLLGSRREPMTGPAVARAAESWRPFRGYAAVHLWTTLLR